MKALASLFVAAGVFAVAAVPSAAASRFGLPAPLGPHAPGVGGGGFNRGGGGHFGGDHFDRRSHGHFVGGSWIASDFYAPYLDAFVPPEPDFVAEPNFYRSHFVGASWIVPSFYAGPPPEPYYRPVPVPAAAAAARSAGPRILYLNGRPANAGKLPVVVYGTYN